MPNKWILVGQWGQGALRDVVGDPGRMDALVQYAIHTGPMTASLQQAGQDTYNKQHGTAAYLACFPPCSVVVRTEWKQALRLLRVSWSQRIVCALPSALDQAVRSKVGSEQAGAPLAAAVGPK